METIKLFIISIITGLCEPLPISGSLHINLFNNLFNTSIFQDIKPTLLIAKLGSLVAIIIIFRKDIANLFKLKRSYKIILKLLLSSLPICLVSLLFINKINNKFLGFAFLLTSLLLFILRNNKGKKNINEISWWNALLIGFITCLVFNSTISLILGCLISCKLCNISKEDSIKYTFLLYIPVSVINIIPGIYNTFDITIIIPFIISCAFTFLGYKWFNRIIKNNNLVSFSIYCLIISAFIFIYF